MSLSWSDAFKSGGMACLYTCLWTIIGGIIILVGVIVGGSEATSINNLGTVFLIILIFYIIGTLIMVIGSFASIIKVAVDTARMK